MHDRVVCWAALSTYPGHRWFSTGEFQLRYSTEFSCSVNDTKQQESSSGISSTLSADDFDCMGEIQQAEAACRVRWSEFDGGRTSSSIRVLNSMSQHSTLIQDVQTREAGAAAPIDCITQFTFRSEE